jgi:hypothetical protein
VVLPTLEEKLRSIVNASGQKGRGKMATLGRMRGNKGSFTKKDHRPREMEANEMNGPDEVGK